MLSNQIFYATKLNIKDSSKDTINIKIEDLAEHYFNIFNRPLNVEEKIIKDVNSKIADINLENFRSISINLNNVNEAIKKTISSNVCGNDGISSRMIKNCNENFIASTILFFYRYIFKYGVIPTDLNITHIIPIIKDKNKSINDIDNLRPISISNTLAQVFERLLLMNMDKINNTHPNQFGYKKKTSCSNALFAFKETVIKYIEDKKICFVAFLDAIKAFDNLWRNALYLKLKNENFLISSIILLKIYYDNLTSKIKINSKFSNQFVQVRGVKQGGVMSGGLFNFFINNLIEEVCNSGVGATFIDISMAIIGFCDDICLLSPTTSDMQILLNICNNFSKNWALEFNVSKCKFIVFGSNKFNSTIFILNDIPLNFSNNIKYLGIEFNSNLNFSNFFIKKFQCVTNSYFALNSFGFKPGGINPFLQSFIYKSFCLSRLLYGFEIMTLNKKTLTTLNISQNNIIRYMTGLSKNSHISTTRKILKILSIEDLYFYMKLIFIKNLNNNKICKDIFNYLMVNNKRNNTLSFIKDFNIISNRLKLNNTDIVNNINDIIKKFKEDCLMFQQDTESELIIICLNNNHDYNMITQLNLVTYAGPLYN